jgi:hypothetical protein
VLEEEAQMYSRLRKYIEMISKEDNDIASHVIYKDGYAQFWHQEDGYVLVLDEKGKYWGNEELNEFNDIRFTADELYVKLLSLQDANVSNFYGMRNVIEKLLEEEENG